MVWPVSPFVNELSTRGRVLIIGGVAVILHGLNRHTKDIDIWLDPLPSIDEWAALLDSVRGNFPDSYIETLRELAAGYNPFAREMLAELGESVPG